MNALFTAVFSAIALSATVVSATDVEPNSVIQLQAGANEDLCVSGDRTADPVGSNLSLAPCGSPLTGFVLPGGAPFPVTQIALNETLSGPNGPAACISAHDLSFDTKPFLDLCLDDDYQRWHVTGGKNSPGKIVSIATDANGIPGQFCLSVKSATIGAPVFFEKCAEDINFEWITIDA